MLKKNTPLKVVLGIFIVEVIVLISLGITLQSNILQIHDKINTEQITDVKQVDIEIEELSEKISKELIICAVVFSIISVVLGVYMSKVIVYPINKYLKSKDEEKSTEQIALINPAAKRLLKISPEDNTFEDVFHK